MIHAITVDNFGPLHGIHWPALGKLNLIIGGNSSGKTFLLKAIYSSLQALEMAQHIHPQRAINDLLSDKLRHTFQVAAPDELRSRGSTSDLAFSVTIDHQKFSYGIGRGGVKAVQITENQVPAHHSHSVFLPAKEVLSLHSVILQAPSGNTALHFDDTYLDLVRALRMPMQARPEGDTAFTVARAALAGLLGGAIAFDTRSDQWLFTQGANTYTMGVTAEGIRKIGILDVLLGNHYLDRNSVVFIDEPGSALHPAAIAQLLDIVALLADQGVQFFMASHSYFVVKKLFLIAQARGWSIPILSAQEVPGRTEWVCDDLLNGVPENPIFNESLRLHSEEIGLTLL